MRHSASYLLKYLILLLFILCISACEKKDSTPPGMVTNLTAIGEVGQVSLAWTEPVDTDLASIEITQSPGNNTYAQASGLNGITISQLSNGTSFDFAVVAVDEDGNKSNAAHVSAIPNTPFVVVDPDPDNCDPSAHVMYSMGYGTTDPSDVFVVDLMGGLQVSVTFNRPLDVSTVTSGQTIFLEGKAIPEGAVSFSNDNKTLTFVTNENFSLYGSSSLAAPYMGYMFNLVLIGNDAGNGLILDSNGMALDGDQDGTPGGDFVLGLVIYELI